MWKVKALVKAPNMCRSPVKQPRSITYRNYSPSALTKALRLVVEEKKSVEAAAKRCGVPVTTLKDRVRGRVNPETTKSGPAPLFTLEEEAKLVEHLKKMAAMGYGYRRAEVVDIATLYAVSLHKRQAGHPLTLRWFRNFMERWPELHVQKPRSLNICRAKATSEEVVKAYFTELDKIMSMYNLKDAPERMYIIDEKGLRQNNSPPHIVSASKSTVAVTTDEGSTVTIIGCGNAIGQQHPPYFIFPGQRMRQELLQGCTPGANGTVRDSGWSNSDIFKDYLSSHFLRYVANSRDDEPLLVLYDGHSSHISLPLIDWARQHNILLFVLPAHTSHILQPTDVGCFGPFEEIYNKICHKHMRAHSTTDINKYSICELACKAYSKALSPDNLRSSFKKTGIYPCTSEIIDVSHYEPARALKKTASAPTDLPEPQPVGPQGDSSDSLLHSDSCDLFQKREQIIGQRKKVPRKRRSMSSVTSGKAKQKKH